MTHLEYKLTRVAPSYTTVMERLLELIRLRATVEHQPLNFEGRDRIVELEAELLTLAQQLDDAARFDA